MSNHIFLSEPDCIRIIQTNRVRWSFWAIYILLTTGIVAFIALFSWGFR